jgi:hypothetical protein
MTNLGGKKGGWLVFFQQKGRVTQFSARGEENIDILAISGHLGALWG